MPVWLASSAGDPALVACVVAAEGVAAGVGCPGGLTASFTALGDGMTTALSGAAILVPGAVPASP